MSVSLKRFNPKDSCLRTFTESRERKTEKLGKKSKQHLKRRDIPIHFRVLDAADYGVPQHRERLFIVGLREGSYQFPYPTHGPDSPGCEPFYTAGEAVAGADISEADEGIGGRYGHLLTDIPPGLNYSFYTEEMGHPQPVFSWRSKFSDFLYKADPKMPVRTIKAQGGQYTGPFSWENRRFTLAELKRLQTFPDDYEIVGNRQVCIEQIGNSVPPQLGRILALSILEQVMGVKLPFPMHYLPPSKKLGFRQRKRQLTERYAQKAKDAIALLYKTQQPTAKLLPTYAIHEQTVRFLAPDFAWNENQVSNSIKINLKYDLNHSAWTITAQKSDIWKEEYQYVIEITPAFGYEGWVLGANKVKLCANDIDPCVFTALWKALEEKIIELTGMADLVQLSGYYQYSPRIRGRLTFHPNLKIERFGILFNVSCKE
jgi:DNA (cytosine-5)-methyltransferase 1